MSNQSDLQAAIRNITGTTGTLNEDWHALFDAEGIAAGTFNERQLAWINAQLAGDYAGLPQARAAYAAEAGVARWDDVTTVVYGLDIFPDSPNWSLVTGGWSVNGRAATNDGVSGFGRAAALLSGIIQGDTQYNIAVQITGGASPQAGSVIIQVVNNAFGNPAVFFSAQLENGTYRATNTTNSDALRLDISGNAWLGTVTVMHIRPVL